MTTGRKPTKPKGEVKKLKIKKETLKDLGPEGKGVKGGWIGTTRSRACGTDTGL